LIICPTPGTSADAIGDTTRFHAGGGSLTCGCAGAGATAGAGCGPTTTGGETGGEVTGGEVTGCGAGDELSPGTAELSPETDALTGCPGSGPHGTAGEAAPAGGEARATISAQRSTRRL